MAFNTPDNPFTGYSPGNIPGAYNFSTGDGRSFLVSGQGADQLRRQIDMQPKPQPTAEVTNQDVSRALGGYTDPSWAQPNTAPPTATDATRTPKAEMPTAPVGPPPQPVRNLGPGEQAPTGQTGNEPQKQINPSEFIQRVHSTPHWQDVSKKVTTTGGTEDPALRQAMLEAKDKQFQAWSAEAEAQKLNELRNVQLGTIQARDAAKEADDLQQKQTRQLAAQVEAGKEYDRLQSVAMNNLNDASGKQIETDIFKGKPGARLGAAISAGLGAFGAALTHTPNFALDIINKSIDDSIMSQRDRINRGVNAAQTDLARIRDKYNVSNSTAEKLYGIFANQRAQSLARQQAATMGTQEAMARAAQIDSALADKNAAAWNQIKNDIYGQASTSAEQKFIAGGDAYRVNPALKATAEAAKYIGETGQGMGTAAEGTYKSEHEGMTPAQEAKIAAGGKGGKLPAKLASLEAVQDAALKDLANYSQKGPKGYVSPIGKHGGALSTDARVDLDTRASSIAGKIAQATNGNLSETEIQHFQEMLGSPYEKVRKAAAEHLEEAIKSTREGIENQRGGTMGGAEDLGAEVKE